MFGIIGYVLLLTNVSNGVKFFGCFLTAIAVYNGPGLNLTWLNVNVSGARIAKEKQATDSFRLLRITGVLPPLDSSRL